MVEASRMYPTYFLKKPKVILDSRFSKVNNLKIGEKGQLAVDLEVVALELEMDEDSNEQTITSLEIKKIQSINEKDLKIESKKDKSG